MPRFPEKREHRKSEKGGREREGIHGKCPEVGEFGPTPVFCLTGRDGDRQRRLELHVGACQLIEKNLGHDTLRVR